MYEINHYLFGWDYIQWQINDEAGISRVHKLPDGRVIFFLYSGENVAKEITEWRQVLWLTCSPKKYGFQNE